MALEIKIPSPGESITEVELASWFVEDGALVTKNQEIGEMATIFQRGGIFDRYNDPVCGIERIARVAVENGAGIDDQDPL